MKSSLVFGLLALVCLGLGVWSAARIRLVPEPGSGGRMPQHPALSSKVKALRTILEQHGDVLRHNYMGDIQSQARVLEADNDQVAIRVTTQRVNLPDEPVEIVTYFISWTVLDTAVLQPTNDAISNPALEQGWYCNLHVRYGDGQRGYIETAYTLREGFDAPGNGVCDQMKLYLDSEASCQSACYLLREMATLRQSPDWPDV